MPRYYFDICERNARIPDEEGTDCPNMDAAIGEAKASARDLVKQFLDAGRSISGCYIAIRDEKGGMVAKMPLSWA